MILSEDKDELDKVSQGHWSSRACSEPVDFLIEDLSACRRR